MRRCSSTYCKQYKLVLPTPSCMQQAVQRGKIRPLSPQRCQNEAKDQEDNKITLRNQSSLRQFALCFSFHTRLRKNPSNLAPLRQALS